MSATLLELTRSLHEDLERFERGILDELGYHPKTFKANIFQTHRVNKYLDGITESSKKLMNIYDDKDGARKEEMNSMYAQGPNVFSIFYDKLREIKDYHRRFPETVGDRPEDHLYFDEVQVASMFSGEEGWGKALDLHSFFDTYSNMKGVTRVDYITYLNTFYKFTDNMDIRDDPTYQNYIKDLFEYLIAFIRKSQPLHDLDSKLKELHAEFESKWESNEFKGWGQEEKVIPKVKETKNEDKKKLTQPDPASDPLFCKACNKLFAKNTVFTAHLKGKKHLQNQMKIDDVSKIIKTRKNFKEIYRREYFINNLATTLLVEQIDNTKINIQKKQSMTLKEYLASQEEEEEEIEEDVDSDVEEPEIKMSIENYPVGWDGKPIPYWLYKLHGLGVEYKCEICGNTSYWGRKAYEKHFQEWRHAFGMRCLGIPNTKHFHEITKINDAIALWNKLRKDKWDETWKPDAEEEFEDREGNVFNKKTFDDMRRQGLI